MKRTWADIDAKRPRYDPEAEGFGNPREWRSEFGARMGFEEAQEVLRGHRKSPHAILGILPDAQWKSVVTAYRRLAKATHPDRIAITGLTKAEAEKQFKEVGAAFAVLAREYRQ